MSKALRVVCVVTCAIFVAQIALAQSRGKKPAAEPTVFNENNGAYEDGSDPFDDPVPLPDKVLDALRVSEAAKSVQDELKNMGRDEFAQLFTAVKIHLSGPKEIDYVVLGGFPMGGADAPWFWIVRFDQTHPKVLFFTFANGFEVLKTRNNGYPNIRSIAFAGGVAYTRIYHYNGQRYILARKYQKKVR